MTQLKLFYHPLSSYSWKALIALYENGTAFTPFEVEFGNPNAQAALKAAWPMERFPVLEDHARGAILPESSVVIEYVSLHYPGNFDPIPENADAAIETRLMDRIFDNFVMTPMQTVVFGRIRPDGKRDFFVEEQARAGLAKVYDLIEGRIDGRQWAAGDAFTLADCAGAPSLYYADKIVPFRASHPVLAAYIGRLEARPSFARVLKEAAPYAHMFPSD